MGLETLLEDTTIKLSYLDLDWSVGVVKQESNNCMMAKPLHIILDYNAAFIVLCCNHIGKVFYCLGVVYMHKNGNLSNIYYYKTHVAATSSHRNVVVGIRTAKTDVQEIT